MIKEFAVISRENKKKITKFASGGGDGAEIIYSLRNNDTFSSKIAKELEQAGQNVRKYYQRRLPSNPAKDYYYIMRDTPNNETVIIEYGFADSNGDDVSQIKNNWQDLAEAATKAIVEYAGGKYIAPMGSNYYTVQKGDSLWSIARKFGTTVDDIKKANNLSGNLLNIGQNLIIPGKGDNDLDFMNYVVVKGDSLYKIAQKFVTTVDKLKFINNLTTDALAIGQVLKIPVNKEINENDNSNIDTYIVEKGDSLYRIAQKFNTTVDELISLNGLSTTNLSIGQILKIPYKENNYNVYTVNSRDTLYSIARQFNTTVNAIMELNNLTTTVLSIGQKLLIP